MQIKDKVLRSINYAKPYYDLVIVGGGIVGLSLVSKLSSHPFFQKNKILLIEKNDILEQDYSKESLRVYAMTKSSLNFLGLKGKLQGENLLYKNFCGMQVWKDDRPSYLTFDMSNISDGHYGSIVNENYIMGHLLDSLKDKNIDILIDEKIADFDNQKNKGVDIHFAKNKSIKTGLLVASDGANSTVAKKAGVYKHGYSHHQRGLVAHLQTSGHNDFAFQKYFHNEVMGILPLSFNRASIVWSVSPEYYQKLVDMSDTNFIEEINMKLHKRNNIKKVSNSRFIKPPLFTSLLTKRVGFPLNTMWLETYSKDNIAFIGDSAHSIHPMLGQGLNLGINDASIISKLIVDQLERGGNISQSDFLDEYSVLSMTKNQAFHTLVEILKTAYFNENPIIDGVRDLSLDFINRTNALKTVMTRIANSD